ncbi:MAG: hypothetical protein R3212_08755 [Xanthomonadales bacterium]|nr:hypothetical protein [Xanthomonadales bacterium]
MIHRQTIAVVVLVLAACGLAQGQEPGARETPVVVAGKEYFVQQKAGEAIVVRASAFEAEFTVDLAPIDNPGVYGRAVKLRDAR